MKTHLITALFLIATVALADDFKTIDGKEFKNVKVSRVEPDGIVVITSVGISKIYFVELPKEVQERFHYNAAKAAPYSAEQAGRLSAMPQPAQPQESSQESTREGDKILWVEISQVLPNGVLAYGQVTHKAFFGRQTGGNPPSGRYYDVPSDSGKAIFIQGFTGSDVAEGERFQVQAYADGTYTYQDTSGASRTLEKWVFTKLIHHP